MQSKISRYITNALRFLVNTRVVQELGQRLPVGLKKIYWSSPSLLVPEVIHFEGLKLYGKSVQDAGLYKKFIGGTYETGTVDLLKRLLGPGMTFVDIGAHVGYYSLIAAKLVGPSGKVYAFEPEHENFHGLKNNIELNKGGNVTDIIAIQKALSNRTGVARLNLGKYSETNSLYTPVAPTDRYITVETTTLDAFWEAEEARLGPLRIDVVKIDVEGAEPVVLEGMSRLLGSKSPRVILEFNPQCLVGAGVSVEGFLHQLFSLFKTVRVIDEDRGIVPLKIPSFLISALEKRRLNERYTNLLCDK